MINEIGEATMQQYIRTNYNSEITDKDLAVQRTDRVRENRSIEKSDNGEKSEMDLKSQDNTRSRNNIEDGKLVVEKYDDKGNLIKKTPPGYLPIGEMV